MKRREFCASSIAAAGTAALGGVSVPVSASPQNTAEFPVVPGLTKYVAEFVVKTRYEDIPENVLELGKKSILDGFGLSLAGSVSEMGPLVRQYLGSFVTRYGQASIIGSALKLPV